MITEQRISDHYMKLASAIGGVRVIDEEGKMVTISDSYNEVISLMRKTHKSGNKIIFIGNGGSAAIASHMAIDYTKNGGIRAIAFNDASLLTCLGNDMGYENLFSSAIGQYSLPGDIVIAISSSGESDNIINGVDLALQKGCEVITLSGFNPDNSLRQYGLLNFYVSTKKGEYGFTEIAHLAILHTILDMICEENKK